MKDIIKNDIYFIAPKNKNIYLGSNIEKIYKREDTILKFFKEDTIDKNSFYFHYDKSDKCFLIISAQSKKCLGIYDDDKDMKLSLVELSANANCKWIINRRGNYSELLLKSKKLYLTLINNSFCKLLQKNNSISQQFTFIILKQKKYNLYNLSLLANNILNSVLPPEHIFNEVEININEVKNLFSKKNITRVEITNEVLIMDDKIFFDLDNIDYVKCIPEYLRFFNRKNLKTIIINEGSEIIKQKDFEGCYNLISIVLPESIKSIDEFSFKDCVNLKNIKSPIKFYKHFNISFLHLPENQTILTAEIFQNWHSLENLELHDKVIDIEIGAFLNCESLEQIEIPDGIYLIPEAAFFNCKNLEKIIIPDSVIDIHYTAFKGCSKLNKIICSEKLRPKLSTVLVIKDNRIKIGDYNIYSNIEHIEIPYDAIVEEGFLNQFKYLKSIKCEPKLLLNLDINIKEKIVSFIIPNGVEFLNNDEFRECIELQSLEIPETVVYLEEDTFINCKKLSCVKCKSYMLQYLNKINLQTIFIINDLEEIDINTFVNCINLKTLILPEYFIDIISNLNLSSCKRLLNINFSTENSDILITKEYKMDYEIEPYITKIYKKDFENWENLKKLTIPFSVEEIEENAFKNCYNINEVTTNPKFLKYFIEDRIENIIVPEYIEEVDENDFNGCLNIKVIEFLGKYTKLKGNDNKSFNNLKIITGYPRIFLTLNEKLKEKIKNINLNPNTKTILAKCFSNYKNLINIKIPYLVEDIEEYAFEGCSNLEQINIPDNVKYLDLKAFSGCKKLTKVKCHPKYLKSFIDCEIKEVTLSDRCADDIDENLENYLKEIKNFKKLQKIVIPENINKIPDNILSECPFITSIKCNPNVLKNMKKEDKRYILDIEIHENFNIDEDTFKDFDGVYNIILPSSQKLTHKFSVSHQTSIEDLEIFDTNNKKYSNFIRKIIDLCGNKIVKNQFNTLNSLEGISQRIGEICRKIRMNSSKKFMPHTVQILSVLRLADSIINKEEGKKGAIAEIKTGEGKSYIISILSILLVKYYKKKIDIVTSTVELARRDNEEQSEFYELFNIKSGVLFNLNEYEFMNINLPTIDIEFNLKSKFNTEVFEKDIVYSTNYNFEFIYLLSLFNKNSLRKRPYDLVIVDEVDNMFIDQSTSPAVIGKNYPISFSNDILEIVFILQNQSIQDIKKVLEYYFPENIANFDDDKILMLKNAALKASRLEKDVDYIIEKEEIIILDQTTGYKKPGQKWENFLHEMVEIKECLPLKETLMSFCSVTQNLFFNLYKEIIGVTGTIGEYSDENLLKEIYNINIFKVPRNIPPRKPIYYKKRAPDISGLYEQLYFEIIENRNEGRPILVIFDSPKRVNEFIVYLLQFNIECLTIQGINGKDDNENLKKAGEFRQITIATSAAGRGMDIKLSKESLKAGGLHVIIPFKMPNKRVLDQAIGRSARQGQPGSSTVYYSENDKFYSTPVFNPTYSNLLKLQNKFDEYLKKSYSWLFSYDHIYKLDNVSFNFGIDINKILSISEVAIKEKKIKPNEENAKQLYSNYFYDMILNAWCFFYSNIETNKIEDIEECNQRYNKLLEKIQCYIPKDNSLDNIIDIYKPKKNIIKYVIEGLEITAFICSFIFPEIAPAIIIGNTILTGGLKIYNKLSQGEKVNWGALILEIFGATMTGLCLPGCGKFGEFIAESDFGKFIIKKLEILPSTVSKISNYISTSLGKYLTSCASGNSSPEELAKIFLFTGLEFLSKETLIKLGKRFLDADAIKNSKRIQKLLKKGKEISKKFKEFRKKYYIIDDILVKLKQKYPTDNLKLIIESACNIIKDIKSGELPIDIAVDLILNHNFKRLNDVIADLPDIGEKLVKNQIYQEIFSKAQEDLKSGLKSLLLGTENGKVSIKDYCEILIKGGFNQLKNKIMNNNEEDDKNINDKNKNMNNKKDKNEKNDKNIDEEDKVLKEIFFETSEKFVDTILKGDFSIDKMIDIFLDAGFKGFDTFFLNKIFNTLNEEEKSDAEEIYEQNIEELKNMAIKGTKIGIRNSFEIILKKIFTEGFSPSILKEAILIGGFQEGYKYFKEETKNWIINQNEYFKFYNDNIAQIFEKYLDEN